jgi:hypothetical protein
MSTENNKDLDIVALVGEKRSQLIAQAEPHLDRYILCQLKLQQLYNQTPRSAEAIGAVIIEMQDAEAAIACVVENYDAMEQQPVNLHTPKPLFTTEDGWDIYETSNVFLHGVDTNTWMPGMLHSSLFKKEDGWKWFSNEYNRDRYILMNKPTLSVNEVLDIFRDHEVFDELVSALQERAKAKL